MRVWRAPLLLALATAVGLTAALLGDGAWDAAGWWALGLPPAVALRCLRRHVGGRMAIPSRTPVRRV